MDVITPEPEDGLVGRMDGDVDFSFDMDGDAIMVSPSSTLVI